MRSSAACWVSALLLLLGGASRAGEDAEPGLAALLERMAATRGVEAHYRETRELSLLSVPLESRGSLYFVPPDRMARFQTEPAFSALVVDGDTVRFREAEREEIDLSGSPVARAFVENFLVLWSGDRERLERLYRPRLEGSDSAWTLELVPRNERLARYLAGVALAGGAGGLQRMLVRDADGDRTTTWFERVELDRAFDEAELERLFTARLPLPAPAGAP
jgi:outer membrane lipoprotein-sorting protein